MSDRLTDRLNEILPKITSDDFLTSRGLGNEIAFYIFDYTPPQELRVRDHVRFLLEHIPRQKPYLRVEYVHLFELVIDHLKDRKLLGRSFRMPIQPAALMHKAILETGDDVRVFVEELRRQLEEALAAGKRIRIG